MKKQKTRTISRYLAILGLLSGLIMLSLVVGQTVQARELPGIVHHKCRNVTRNGPVSKDADRAVKARISANYGNLPLYFISNRGQVNARVAFYETGTGHATFFTRKGIVLSLRTAGAKGGQAKRPDALTGKALRRKPSKARSSNLSINILGMNKDVEIVPEGKQGCTPHITLHNRENDG